MPAIDDQFVLALTNHGSTSMFHGKRSTPGPVAPVAPVGPVGPTLPAAAFWPKLLRAGRVTGEGAAVDRGQLVAVGRELACGDGVGVQVRLDRGAVVGVGEVREQCPCR